MHMSLSCAKSQALREYCTNGELVDQAAIHPGDGNNPALATGHDRLAKSVGPVGFQHEGILGTIIERTDGHAVSFQADSVDTCIRTSRSGHLLQRFQNILFVEVENF